VAPRCSRRPRGRRELVAKNCRPRYRMSESKDTPARHSETDAAPGARASRSAQEQLDSRAGALTCKALDMAESGNVAALRLCFERILPIRKERPVSFNLPATRSAADAAKLMGAVIEAMACGDVAPSQAAEMARVIDTFVRTLVAAEIEQDLAELRKTLRDSASSELGRKP
jgi:hypothetical protein